MQIQIRDAFILIARILSRKLLNRLAVCSALGMAMCSINVLAQSGAGSIQGTVKDPSGAVIPGASIHVINQGTGQAIDTKSNGTGFYSVPSLFAGDYTLTFTTPGMKQYKTSISLQVAQTAVISPSLATGSVHQEVVVTGNAIQLATYDSGTISSELDNQRINQLPENGRSLLGLNANTTPGLEGGNRANGLLTYGIEYVQDGAPINDRNAAGPSTQADPDAIQEVKTETVDSNAEFAMPATAIITTKSGTNQLHGSFFETAENNYFGIAKARQDPSNLIAPHYVRNEFGASVGGPVVIPKLYNGKDKSFFFFAYERYSLRAFTSRLVEVPTQAMRNGDFSGLVNGSGQLQVLYDPNTSNPVTFQRTPFPNNQIPLSRISPLAKTLYAITPLPTSANNPLVSSNFTQPGLNNATTPNITFRLDHTFNQKNRAYVRYTFSDASTATLLSNPTYYADAIAGAGLPAGVSNENRNLRLVDSAAAGYTRVFSPTLVSETVFGNEWENDETGGGGNPLQDYEAELGLPNNFGQAGFPEITGALFTDYYGTQYNWGGSQIISNLDENITKTLKRHQLFFGGRYLHERLGILPDRTPDDIAFDGYDTGLVDPATTASKAYTPLANTGNAAADLFLGGAFYFQQELNPPYERWRNQEFDTYFQDDFHVNDKFTLNAGIRWEVHPVDVEQHNLVNGFDFNNDAVVLGEPISQLLALGYTTQNIITNLQNLGVKFETPQAAGLPSHLVYPNDFVFSPRIGFAYAPFGAGHGTVFRGGFGRYAFPIPLRNFYGVSRLSAPFAESYSQNYNLAAQSPDGQPNYLLRAPQTIITGQNSADVVNSGQSTSLLPGVSERVLNSRYPPNFSTQFNATIEQPLKPESVLRVSYVYNRGSNLDQNYNHNNTESSYVWEKTTGTVPPTGTYSGVALNPFDNHTYATILTDDRNGFSVDNALQLNYQRLYKHGYAYQIFYVYSRAMRVGGNSFSDDLEYPYADYAPGAAPSSDPVGLDYFENYQIDTAIPEHHISFNGIVDLPFGRGKRFLGNVNRFTDELIGGYQIAFVGNVVSQYFQPYAGNWGPTNPLHVYKKKYKVNDCSSGVCHPGYLWFNGFISPLVANAATNGISGIPGNYLPYQSPINTTPGTANFLTNNVTLPLLNGKTVNVAYSPGPSGVNPYSHTVLHGPFNYSPNISIFKVFPITETVNFRVNVDAFNAFNIQGYTNPNTTTGIQNFLASYNTPRQIQLTARLTF